MSQQSTNNGSTAPAAWSKDPSLYSWVEAPEPRTDSPPAAPDRRETVADETLSRPAGKEAAGHRVLRDAGPPSRPETDPGREPPKRSPVIDPTPTPQPPEQPAAAHPTQPGTTAAPGAGPAPTTAGPPPPRPELRTTAEPDIATAPARPTGGLSNDDIVRHRSERPHQGWQAALYSLTGGRWNRGPGPAESRFKKQLARIKTPLPGPYSVVTLSLKGGIGKTTMTAALGLCLAEYRGDRAIAIDANPDAGTLADRLTGNTKVTIRDMLDDLPYIDTSTDVTRYTDLAGRLQVLASDQDPGISEQLSSDEYEAILDLLSRFYDIMLTDSGTGITHPAMKGTLQRAQSLMVVAAPTVDGASRGVKTLDWLATHGFEDLVRDAVVAVVCDRSSPDVNQARIESYFQERCRAVVAIPPDPHLRTGGEIRLDSLAKPTLDAVLELTANVAVGFHGHRPADLRPRLGRR